MGNYAFDEKKIIKLLDTEQIPKVPANSKEFINDYFLILTRMNEMVKSIVDKTNTNSYISNKEISDNITIVVNRLNTIKEKCDWNLERMPVKNKF